MVFLGYHKLLYASAALPYDMIVTALLFQLCSHKYVVWGPQL